MPKDKPGPEKKRYPRVKDESHTFANFDRLPGTGTAIDTMKAMAEGKSNIKMLLLLGTTGCGKTHLVDALIMRMTDLGIYIVYNTWCDIADNLRGHLSEYADPPYETLLHRYCFSPRLIIDDFGMGSNPRNMDWEYAQLEKIVKYRYREELFTVIATNNDTDELPDRIVSCFSDSDIAAIVLNSAEDYRTLKEKSNGRG